MSKLSLFISLILITYGWLEAQEIESFIYSECDQSCDIGKVVNRISKQSFNNGVLKIYFGHISNCAGISNPTADLQGDTLVISYESYLSEYDTIKVYDSILNDTTILEIWEANETQSIMLCDCYFKSEFQITGLTKIPSHIKLNGNLIEYYPDKYKVLPIEFDLMDGDTINFQDRYGYRQGLWIERNSNNQLIFQRVYETDLIVEGTDYRYHENGIIKSKLEWVNDEHSDYYEYDSNGNLVTHKKSPFDN